MMNKYKAALWMCLATALAVVAAAPAYADWWIVRSADARCLVVDIEPAAENGVTKIGKDKYGSAEEAEADAKRLCGSDDGPAD